MQALPTAQQVAAFMDAADDADGIAKIAPHLSTVTAFVRSYTRGVGFGTVNGTPSCEEDIAAVIVSATARSANNPTQLVRAELGEWNETPASFTGFTLVEQFALHNYRRRTA